MLRFTKRFEYGIIALRHMLNQPAGRVTSAKEISRRYNIPTEIMAKILQRLAREGFIDSSQGSRGGYVLAKDSKRISLNDIVESIEGRPFGIVDCMTDEDCQCVQMPNCNINEPFKVIQKQLKIFLSGISLADIDNEIGIQHVTWN